MIDKKVWEFEGDWYVQVGSYLPTCINTKEMAESIAEEFAQQQQIKVKPEVKPVYGHKRTAKQFFIEQYQEGKCEDITTNPYPEFNNAFYLNIYKLMEDYSKSV